MNYLSYFERITASLKTRMSQFIRKGLASMVDDTGDVQTMQVSFSETDVQDNIFRLQNYGFTSVPPDNSDTYVLYPNGERSTGLAFSVESFGDRPKNLKSGDVALYHRDGSMIVMTKDGNITLGTKDMHTSVCITDTSIELSNKSAQIKMTSGSFTITNNGVDLADQVQSLANIIANLQTPVPAPPGATPATGPFVLSLADKASALKVATSISAFKAGGGS